MQSKVIIAICLLKLVRYYTTFWWFNLFLLSISLYTYFALLLLIVVNILLPREFLEHFLIGTCFTEDSYSDLLWVFLMTLFVASAQDRQLPLSAIIEHLLDL